MTVTTKKAMDMAIQALQEKEQTDEIQQAIHKLQRLAKRDLVAEWSRESIIEALENWRKEHNGSIPTVTALAEPGMPGCGIIQKYFGMRASAFLRQRYPSRITSRHKSNRYGFSREQDWLECFREQFEKHCRTEGFNSKTYNTLRDKDTPLWTTIAYHVGTAQWGELMNKAGVKYPDRRENADPDLMHVRVSNHPLIDKWEACQKRAEEHSKVLIEELERTSIRTKFLDAWLEMKFQEDPHISRITIAELQEQLDHMPADAKLD